MSITLFSETAIFERIVLPQQPPLTEQAARSLLAIGFSPEDLCRLDALAEKARQGTLTVDESQEIDNFERVGHYLAILQSKARIALGQASRA